MELTVKILATLEKNVLIIGQSLPFVTNHEFLTHSLVSNACKFILLCGQYLSINFCC